MLCCRYSYEDCKATADWLLTQTDLRPLVGIVCGSGMGGLADMLKNQVGFNYKDIPNFPQSTGENNKNNWKNHPGGKKRPERSKHVNKYLCLFVCLWFSKGCLCV